MQGQLLVPYVVVIIFVVFLIVSLLIRIYIIQIAKIDILEGQARNQDQIVCKLRDNLAEIRNGRTRVIARLRSDNAKYRANIARLRSDNVEYRAYIDRLCSDNAEYRAYIARLRSDNIRYRAYIARLCGGSSRLKTANKVVAAGGFEVQAYLDNIRTKVAESESVINQFEEEIQLNEKEIRLSEIVPA